MNRDYNNLAKLIWEMAELMRAICQSRQSADLPIFATKLSFSHVNLGRNIAPCLTAENYIQLAAFSGVDSETLEKNSGFVRDQGLDKTSVVEKKQIMVYALKFCR